jgi:hypothetical protein
MGRNEEAVGNEAGDDENGELSRRVEALRLSNCGILIERKYERGNFICSSLRAS